MKNTAKFKLRELQMQQYAAEAQHWLTSVYEVSL